jgi:hypothetical protein
LSRFRRAVVAAALAVAATGGALFTSAASAAPAYAAAMKAPAATTGGHTTTITFRRAAPAASSAGPNVILPCAVHSPGAVAGAVGADDTCSSGVVTCNVTASDPYKFSPTGLYIYFDAETYCSEDVPQISMGQDVIHSTPIDPNNPLTDFDVVNGGHIALTSNEALCQPGQYAVNASARITPPDGYVASGSLHDTSATVTIDCPGSGGGGGGGGGAGGGGCSTVSSPTASTSPDPFIITCP